MNYLSIESFLKACTRCLQEAKPYRHLCLPVLVLLTGCDQLRVQNLPSSKLACDANLVGVWEFDSIDETPDQQEPYGINDDDTRFFAYLSDDCRALYGVDFTDAALKTDSVNLVGSEIRSFTLNEQTFMVAARDPERDTADAFENGYFLLRYKVQADKLKIEAGDVYSATKDIDANAVPGMILRSKNTDGSSIVALLTGTGTEIAHQIQKQKYYAKYKLTLRRANAVDTEQILQLVSEF